MGPGMGRVRPFRQTPAYSSEDLRGEAFGVNHRARLAGKSKGYVPQQFGFGGPGGPGGFQRPLPGDVLPPNTQNALQMTEAQKKELAELQKKVDAELEKILTPDQRAQLKRMREGGMGGPPGFPPLQAVRKPSSQSQRKVSLDNSPGRKPWEMREQ